MKLITFHDILSAEIDPKLCYDWVEEALLQKETAMLPAKISIKPAEGVFYNTMPVILPEAKAAGMKLVTRYPERVPSLQAQILLYDFVSGEAIALMDGTWITTMRTGAVAAHSIKLLAKKDFQTMGFIGLGNTARATLLVLLSLYPDRPLTIKLKRYKDQHTSFAERFAAYSNLTFTYHDTYEEVIGDSDVVVSAATYFDSDICSPDCFKEGVLLVPVHTRGFTACDLVFDKVFADDTDHVRGFKNFGKFKTFAEVSDILTGKTTGRESDRERIIAYNIGIALHDLYFASKLYALCKDLGQELSLDTPEEKFWI